MQAARFASVLAGASALASCSSTEAESVDERRAFVQLLKQTTLTELEAAKPETRGRIEGAAGWAVFGDAGASAFGAKPGVGFGVAHARSGAESYLRMRRPGAETGAPPFRLVLVFADPARFQDFAKAGGSFEGPPPAGVEAWQLFAEGPALEPDLVGLSFYPDPDLKSAR